MNLNTKGFVVITGGSQGIGRVLALELSNRLGAGSLLTLIARNAQALHDVKEAAVAINTGITVNTVALDLTNPDIVEYEKLFDVANKYDYAIIFHNAGQIGSLTSAIDLTNIQKWRDYFDLNFFSVGILNSIFVKSARKFVTGQITVVNISSLCAKSPFGNLAMYSSGKAARSIYFQVFAVEESDVKVLNYCPGPVETAMFQEIIADVKDETTKKCFIELRDKQIVLTPELTTKKLLNILQEGSYKSGDVIDYFDVA